WPRPLQARFCQSPSDGLLLRQLSRCCSLREANRRPSAYHFLSSLPKTMTDEKITGPPARRLYHPLVETVEKYYDEHGDTHRGLGFQTEEGFEARYRVYLEVIRELAAREECSLLDVGCGTARLLDLIKSLGRDEISYRGVDLSPKLLEAARKKHPEADFILGDPFDLAEIWSVRPDYVIFGQIFTCRL